MYRQVLSTIKLIISQPEHPIILILGLRQVGKSTLAQTICKGKKFVRFNFDLLSDISEFTDQDRHNLELFAERYKNHIIIVDEVQKSPEAVGIIKHLYDSYKLNFILTDSSELKIRQHIGDSLAGRVKEFRLYPLSLSEIDIQSGLAFTPENEIENYEFNQKNLLQYLIYGSLPKLRNIKQEEYSSYLDDLTNGLLSKDVLEISGTKKPAQVFHLAKLLAHQIGQIINYNELAENTNLSRISVVNYIEIFEQMGLVARANPISTNTRESITKRTKIYFTDLGIRNSLINNFYPFETRQDKGQLLENAVFIGIKRQLDYAQTKYELGFFRSAYGSEIDIVKKVNGKEELFEIKTSKRTIRNKNNVVYINLQTAQTYLY